MTVATINRTEQTHDAPPLFLDANETAEILRVHPRTVARMCERGELRAVKVRSLWRINREALFELAGLK